MSWCNQIIEEAFTRTHAVGSVSESASEASASESIETTEELFSLIEDSILRKKALCVIFSLVSLQCQNTIFAFSSLMLMHCLKTRPFSVTMLSRMFDEVPFLADSVFPFVCFWILFDIVKLWLDSNEGIKEYQQRVESEAREMCSAWWKRWYGCEWCPTFDRNWKYESKGKTIFGKLEFGNLKLKN